MNDNVNHPAHYTDGKIEVIDFIEDKKLGFHLGNTVKYICRAGKKDPEKTIEDLQKAEWYLHREIQRLKAEKAKEEALEAIAKQEEADEDGPAPDQDPVDWIVNGPRMTILTPEGVQS